MTGVRLSLVAQVEDSQLRTQAVVNPFTQASIAHLVIRLYRVAGGVETPVLDGTGAQLTRDLGSGQFGATVSFASLQPNTTYRARAYAYKAAGTSPSDLISTSDSNSYVDIPVTNDDRPGPVILRVRLLDVPFSGQASASGVVITNGGYATGTETIQ